MRSAGLRILSPLLLVAALSACAQTGAWPTNSVLKSTQRYESGERTPIPKDILYVADAGNETTTLYDADSNKTNPSPIGVLSNAITSPTALAVDAVGDVYVANASTASTPADVEMFPPGSKTPTLSYTQGVVNPVALAVDKHSMLYVVNATGPTPAPIVVGPTVVEFPAGSTTPSTTISDPNDRFATAVAVDGSGNVYLVGDSFLCCPYPGIDELAPNPQQPQPLAIAQPLEGSMHEDFQGLAIDASGDLVASDGVRVGVYAPSSMVWPLATPPLTTIGLHGTPQALTFNQHRTKLFATDAANDEVIGYSYPSDTIVNLVTKGVQHPIAVAVAPFAEPDARRPQPKKPGKPPSLSSGSIYINPAEGPVQELNAVSFAEERTLTDHLGRTTGIAVDAHHHIYVANQEERFIDIAIFKPTGTNSHTTDRYLKSTYEAL